MQRALAALVTITLASSAAAQRSVAVAILGAMPEEVATLRARLGTPTVRQFNGVQFVEGTLSGRRVVLARVGVGKVNAAMTTTLLLEHYRPRRVLFTGVAGGLDSTLGPGDLALGTAAAQHDLGSWDANGMSNWGPRPANDTTPNPVRYPGDTLLLRLARAATRASNVHAREGTILTGDIFVANDSVRAALRRRFPDAIAVEMEGAAVAQVCWQTGRVPVLIVRSVSDRAGSGAAESFETFVTHAAARSAALVRQIVATLPR